MAIIYKEFRDTDKTTFYPYDEDQERFYRKVAAGFVPAGPRGGAIVAVGFELVLRPPAAIYWLGEAQGSSTDDLIQKALDMKTEFRIEEFVGHLDESFTRYLSFRNANARESKNAEQSVIQAPNSTTASIDFHVTAVRALLNPTNRLNLGQSEGLRAALQALSKTDFDTATAKEHPLSAALCYAVSHLEVNQSDYSGNRSKSFAKKDYDVLNYE